MQCELHRAFWKGLLMKEAIGATGVFLYFATLLFGALMLQF